MRRRPVVGEYFRTQNNGVLSPFTGGKAGGKDPRDFVSGNTAGQQWDIAQQVRLRQQLENNPPPHISEHARAGTPLIPDVVRNIPTRITFQKFIIVGGNSSVPQLLVPKNTRRMAIQIGTTFISAVPFALSDYIVFSWGNPGSIIGPITGGHTLGPGQPLYYAGDSVPIDDLYIWCPASAAQNFVAFEGTEAPEANMS